MQRYRVPGKKQIKRKHRKKITRKQLIIMVITMSMLLGVIIGSFYALALSGDKFGSLQVKLGEYMRSFSELRTAFNGGSFSAFRESSLKYGKIAVIIWFLALVPAGGFMSIGIMFLRGFGYGFTTAVLIRSYGTYGVLCAVLLFLAQTFILVPTYVYMAYNSIITASFDTDEKGLAGYFIPLCIGCVCCILAGAVDAFITPMFL